MDEEHGAERGQDVRAVLEKFFDVQDGCDKEEVCQKKAAIHDKLGAE